MGEWRQLEQPGRRIDDVQYLRGAAEFSADGVLRDAIWLITAFKQFPQLMRPLEDLTAELATETGGANRLEGNWALLYLIYIMHTRAAAKDFHDAHLSSQVWELCGFKRVPHFNTTGNRFAELEEYAEVFEKVLSALVRKAAKHEPRVVQHYHVDGVSARVNARMHHCCPDPDVCGRRAAGKRLASVVPSAPDDLVAEDRHSEAALPLEEAIAAYRLGDEDHDEENERLLALARKEHGKKARGLKYRWLGKKGSEHLYCWRDQTAGVRLYDSGKTKAHLGGTGLQVTSSFAGLALALHVQSADVNELDGYIPAMAKAFEITGTRPLAVAADRGFSFPAVYEFNTRLGIGSAIPWREPSSGLERRHFETDRYDRHGVPRCKFCGAQGTTSGSGLGFVIDGRHRPIIRFRCELGLTSECAKRVQTLRCAEDWRLLGPLNPTHPVYHQLKGAQRQREHVQGHARDRSEALSMDTRGRPRRVGLPCIYLRAIAGMVLDWFRLSLRLGWLASHKRPDPDVELLTRSAGQQLQATLEARTHWGLDLPRGPAAEKLGLARPNEPPG